MNARTCLSLVPCLSFIVFLPFLLLFLPRPLSLSLSLSYTHAMSIYAQTHIRRLYTHVGVRGCACGVRISAPSLSPLLQPPIHPTAIGISDGAIRMSSDVGQATSSQAINAGAGPSPLSDLPEGLRPQNAGEICVDGNVPVDCQIPLEVQDAVMPTDRFDAPDYEVGT